MTTTDALSRTHTAAPSAEPSAARTDPPDEPPAAVAGSRGWRLAGVDQPEARAAENRGRRWLVLSFLLCPCHLPATIAVLGAVFGSTAIGSFLTASNWRTGLLLAVLYGLALWRGFTHLRRAQDCTTGACRIR